CAGRSYDSRLGFRPRRETYSTAGGAVAAENSGSSAFVARRQTAAGKHERSRSAERVARHAANQISLYRHGHGSRQGGHGHQPAAVHGGGGAHSRQRAAGRMGAGGQSSRRLGFWRSRSVERYGFHDGADPRTRRTEAARNSSAAHDRSVQLGWGGIRADRVD